MHLFSFYAWCSITRLSVLHSDIDFFYVFHSPASTITPHSTKMFINTAPSFSWIWCPSILCFMNKLISNEISFLNKTHFLWDNLCLFLYFVWCSLYEHYFSKVCYCFIRAWEFLFFKINKKSFSSSSCLYEHLHILRLCCAYCFFLVVWEIIQFANEQSTTCKTVALTFNSSHLYREAKEGTRNVTCGLF